MIDFSISQCKNVIIIARLHGSIDSINNPLVDLIEFIIPLAPDNRVVIERLSPYNS